MNNRAINRKAGHSLSWIYFRDLKVIVYERGESPCRNPKELFLTSLVYILRRNVLGFFTVNRTNRCYRLRLQFLNLKILSFF